MKNFKRLGDTIFYWDDKKYGDISKFRNVIYLLKTADNKEYIGQTKNLGARINQHLIKTEKHIFEPPYADGLNNTKSVKVDILAQIDDDSERRDVENEIIVNRIRDIVFRRTNIEIKPKDIHLYRDCWQDVLLNTFS